MAYLPTENEVRGNAAIDADPNESGPSAGKILIVVLFIAAVGLLVAAGVIQVNNRERIASVLDPSLQWADGQAVTLRDRDISPLGQWEKVQVAEEIASRVRQFNTFLEQDPELFGDQDGDMRRRVPTLVTRIARDELGVREHQLEMGRGVNSREWEPPRGNRDMEPLRGRFVTNNFDFTVKQVSREQIVQFALVLEDDYPWITVEQLTVTRMRESPDDQKNVNWEARLTLQWWEERRGSGASVQN